MLRQSELASTENSEYLHVLPYSSMIIADLFQHGIRNSLYICECLPHELKSRLAARPETYEARSSHAASFVLEFPSTNCSLTFSNVASGITSS
jgi:hypothetical protein